MERKRFFNVIGVSAMSMTLLPSVVSAIFPDVPSSHPYADAISFIESEELVKGYPDGTFKPDNNINRAEFMKVVVGVNRQLINEWQAQHPEGPFWEDTMCIYIMGGCDADVKNCFPLEDVRLEDWFAPFVCHAISQELINGYPDGTFRPGNLINFAESAKIIANVFSSGQFSRAEPWYKPYVDFLETRNVIPSTVFGFDAKLTRGEMAEMIYRLRAGNTASDSPKQYQHVAYALYNEQTGEYEVHLRDLRTNEDRVIYSLPWRNNFRAPAVVQYDDSTLMISRDIWQNTLIDLTGEEVQGKFVPPSTHFYFSPSRKTLIYHGYLPPTGITTIMVRNMDTGKEVAIKNNGEGHASICFNPTWDEDEQFAHCNTDNYAFPIELLQIRVADGSYQMISLETDPGAFFPEHGVAFHTQCRFGRGDSVPPCALSVKNVRTGQENLLVSRNQTTISFSSFDGRRIVYAIADDGTYIADLIDIQGTKRKLGDGHAVAFSEGMQNFALVASKRESSDIIDTTSVVDANGTNTVRLFSHRRSRSPEPAFVGWFK